MIGEIVGNIAARIRAIQADPVVDGFHRLWYAHDGLTWKGTRWLGVPIAQNPLDLMTLQEIVWDLRPALIVETGTWHGGEALFLGCLCSLIDRGAVISIDVGQGEKTFDHPRVTFLTGSSVDPAIVATVRARAEAADGPVLVILDADHDPAQVAAELEAYAPLVTVGSYCIVQDTNTGGRPVESLAAPHGGPWVAVERWLAAHPEWESDVLCEHQIFTCHPGGWLKRVA